MKKKQEDLSLWRRYMDGLYTTEDVSKMTETLRNEQPDNFLDEMAAFVWEDSASQQASTDLEREKYKKEARVLLKRIEPRKRIDYRRVVWTAASAAAILCLVFGGVGYWHYAVSQQVSYLEASTTYGEHKEIRLPDGTELILNACSYVRYPDRFVGEERRIDLDGEAFFRVSHNEEQPFIVKSHSFDVKVLGTCFNVKSYSSDEVVSVDVESGKVQVDMPEAMMRLKANEQVLINTVSGDYVKQREEHTVAVWRSGSLRFNATPIHDVAKELERRYNCRITFAEGQTFDNLISGEHDNKSLAAVLESVEYTSGIHYRMKGNQVLLYKD